MGCLDNIIRLSRTTCECVTGEAPAGYNEGQSSVYLDELEGLNLSILSGAIDCGTENIWDLMAKARENATLALKADLMSCLENTYFPRRPNYAGLIGQTAFTSSLNISEQYAGQAITFNHILGGKMVVKRIGLMMDTTLPIQVRVYDNDEHKDTPIASYTINSVANTAAFGVLSTPLELPLWSRNLNLLRYYFVYTVSGFQPKNNKPECIPCSGGAKHVAWSNWIRIHGIKGNGTDYPGFQQTQELNGLVLDAEFKCEAPRVICSDEYPLDFDNSGRAMQIAFAIRFKAGALLLDSILSSPEINRYTMMDREALYGKRNFYRSSYEQWIKYLCENTTVTNNDCWVCRPSNLIKRGTILS